MTQPVRRTVLAMLVLAGVLLALRFWTPVRDGFSAAAVAVAIGLALIPKSRRILLTLQDRLNRTPPLAVAACIFVLLFAVFTNAALTNREYLGPKSHDERSYTLGALMLSAGRLWTQPPPAPDAFESFHILTKPVYASIYSPGTAMLFAVSPLTGVPGWAVAVVLTSLAIALVFLLLRPAIGADLALAAALFVSASPMVRHMSILVMSQVPSLLLGTAALLLALAYRNQPGRFQAVALGGISGLLVITRPQDAAFFLPAALLLVYFPAATNPAPSAPRPEVRATHLGLALLAALPLLSLAILQNVGLTGSAFRTGYWSYTQSMQPGTGFFSHTAASEPGSVLRQKADYNNGFGKIARDQLATGFIKEQLGRRPELLLKSGLPTAGLVILVPLGILGLARRRRSGPVGWAVLAALSIYLLIYGLFTFFLPHYVVPISGCLAAVVAAAPVGVALLSDRLGTVARAIVPALAAALFLASQPGLNSLAADPDMKTGLLALVDKVEADLPHTPALLLIRYRSGVSNFHQEPVYNLKSWDLLSHRVLRAHDLGPDRNAELFRSLSAPGQPQRFVYHFDTGDRVLTPLGWINELTSLPPSSSSSRPTTVPN